MSDVIYSLQTFGCKVNTYDSGLLEKRFAQKGFAAGSGPQVIVLNTCAVTAEATQEALRTARKIKRQNSNAKIVFTGCSAQVDTEKLAASGLADLIVANSHKGSLEDLIRKMLQGELSELVHKSNIFKKDDLEAGGGEKDSHTRSFLKIQDGCNSFCTFCVIPFARGKSRSLTIEDITVRVQDLLDQGVREIVLTGVHIGDYEFGLENLVEHLLLNTRVPRLRLTSLEPIELSDRLLELFQDPRVCPHFHMSIQSANTQVLARMKRKYSAREVESALQAIAGRVSGAFVGMDVIVGFPGEDEETFSDTYQRLANLPWTRIHVFPYSERPGTMAVRLDGKNHGAVIARRADRLRELSHERYLRAADLQVGQVKRVLLLRDSSRGSGLSGGGSINGALSGGGSLGRGSGGADSAVGGTVSTMITRRGLSRDYWNVNVQLPFDFGSYEKSAPGLSEEIRVKITGVSTSSRGGHSGEPALQGQIIS